MRLALTCGYRVFVCSNMAFSGDFTPGTMSPKFARRHGSRLRWRIQFSAQSIERPAPGYARLDTHIPPTTIVSESIGQTCQRAGLVPELLT
jgi:hypothetical protein